VRDVAVLGVDLHLLRRNKIKSEIAYLEIGVSKTAGPAELEAWEWLMEKIRAHYGAAASPAATT